MQKRLRIRDVKLKNREEDINHKVLSSNKKALEYISRKRQQLSEYFENTVFGPLKKHIMKKYVEGKINNNEFKRKMKELESRKNEIIQNYLDLIIDANNKLITKKLANYLEKYEKDVATGLYKKEIFMEKIKPIFEEAKYSAFLFADMDGLKKINDTFGHQVADDYIVAYANALKKVAEKYDTGKSKIGISLSRLYGDEFAIFFASNSNINKKYVDNFMKEVKNEFLKEWTKIIEEKNYNSKLKDFGAFSYDIAFKKELRRDFKDVDFLSELAEKKMYVKKISKKMDQLNKESEAIDKEIKELFDQDGNLAREKISELRNKLYSIKEKYDKYYKMLSKIKKDIANLQEKE